MGLLAGCGGGQGKPEAGQTAKSTPTPTTPSTPSTAPDTTDYATVGQYASIVAKNQVGLAKSLTDLLNTRHCTWNRPGGVDVRPGYVTCAIGVLGLGFQADTLKISLQGAEKPGVPAYVGQPPLEIAPLVDDTITAASQLSKATQAASDCTSKASPGCDSKLFDLYDAMTGMSSQLGAWAPYL